jgi:ubiquinone/menaquinone biosynthesis C-methylase UbiE
MFQDWKKQVLSSDDIEYAEPERQIVKGSIPNTMSYEFHKQMKKGAALRELQDQHLHLAYWEAPYLKEAIQRFLQEVDRDNTIVADVGCGDGRFTEYLLELGFCKIIATDLDLRPLQSLALHLDRIGAQDKVLLIHSTVDHLPLKSGICEAVLAIGVLFYLNESFCQGLNELVRVLKPSGTLVNYEPNLEGKIYKSLFLDTLDDVFENYFERTTKEQQGATPFKFKLFTEAEITQFLEDAGLEVRDYHGISTFSIIIRIMMVRGLLDEASVSKHEGKIREIMDYLNHHGKLSNMIIWQSIKKPFLSN